MYKLNVSLKTVGSAAILTDFDNEYFTLDLKETVGAIHGVLTAKKNIRFQTLALTTDYPMDDNDFFFANAYQSWATAEEKKKGDIHSPQWSPLNKIEFARRMATAVGDYDFTNYGVKNLFHSFTFTYFRRRESHFIKLFGSRSERNGYTIFEADMNNRTFTISKDVEGKEMDAGESIEFFDIAVIEDEYNRAFDQYFFNFMNLDKPRVDRLAGYTSWYNYFSRVTEKIVMRDLESLDAVSDLTQIFQIDDGYESAVGDWLKPNHKFPHGMKYCADKIHEKGYLAGLWLAPFNAQITSKVARKHPGWMVKNPKTGKPFIVVGTWGGAYAMDIYNPEVRDYIRHFFDVILNEWGYDMVKLDFLYSACYVPRNGKSRGEIMCDAADLLREACGDKIILGCGVPLGPVMGVFDACRIGPDANKAFKGNLANKLAFNNELPSSRNAMVNSIFRRCLDGRAFANDPDVFFLRDTNLKYSILQKLLLAEVNDLTGSILFVSDNVGDYSDKALEYLKVFFKPKECKIELAEYETDDRIRIEFTENGKNKVLKLNLKTGDSNVLSCIADLK